MKSLDIRVAFSAIDRLTRPVNAARQSAGGLSESLKRTQAAIKDLDTQSRTFNRLRDSVQKTSRKIDEASRSLDGLKKAQQNNTVLTDKQREHMAALAAKLERLNVTRDQEMVKLRAASQALRGHGVSLVGSNATIQSAIRRTEQYNQTLERERRQLAAVTQARARYERMQQAAGKFRAAGTVAAGATIAGAYLGARMMTPGVEADNNGTRVAAQNGESASRGQQYSGIIQTISSEGVIADLNQIGETLGAVRSTLGALGNVGDAELTRITRKALDMQTAFGTDTAEGIQMAAIMMKNGLAKNSDEAFDLMVSGMQRVSTEMRGELPEILHEYSTHFRNLGFNGSEAMSLLVDMAKQGKFALDKTGDAIKEFSIRGSDMSKKSVDAYKTIGLDAAKMSSAIASGGQQAREAMQKTARGLLSIQNPAERANAAIALFGTPIEDLSIDQIPQFLSALARVSNQLGDMHGSADRMGATLRDNLSGDIAQLGGALNGLRFDVLDGLSDHLRGLVQGVTALVNHARNWVTENPKLTQTLLLTVGGALALAAAIGGTSLAIGLLMGPLAKLQLGFSLLLGARGVGGAVSMFSGLSSLLSGPMARMGGWLQLFSGSAGRLTATLTPLRGMLLAVFTSPAAALGSLVRGIGGLLLRLSGLPALWSMITSAVSALGGVLSLLLSPIGLIGAAFVAAGLLIWRFWEPIKTFFSGMFTGIMQALTPLRDAFSRLAPIFDPIWQAVEKVWEWFKKLLEPIGISKESLDKCASAGEAFGRVLGSALELLLWPLQKLMEGIGWILEKLGLIPSGLDAAQKKANQLKELTPEGKDRLQGLVANLTGDLKGATTISPPAPKPPLTGDSGTQRRLQKIADNTGGVLEETKKRIGPGDIVFKNLPKALAVRGEWQESRLTGGTPSAPSQPAQTMQALSDRPAVVAATQPVKQADASPVSRPAARTPAAGGFNGEIHIHLHGVERQDARELGRIVADAVSAELARRDRLQRGSFRDRE
ncbi:phage tail tape measure protein [Dickeya dianthicola]|uniref:phage tail tape measure protein n=1 Tax=Dickeya dianthicola TaxID=204039 RepID=UPI001F60466D|nr:phage tail tape measure protein [Dickeya dianthicola]MCI4217759.1 phage tail tape measure protein [Dickeya dianthicola]